MARRLQVDLLLTDLRPICDLEGSPPAALTAAETPEASGSQFSSVSPADAGEGAAGTSAAQEPASVVYREQSLTLRGGDRVRLRLELWPQQPGLLRVRGLQWALNGVALGQRIFQPRLRKTAKCAASCSEPLTPVLACFGRRSRRQHGA